MAKSVKYFKNSAFSRALNKWYIRNKRELPWRESNDPYRIWLSEVILQQTQVAQGLSYYNVFIKHFPEVKDLAKAKTDQVMRLWQGLGYYSRARNLHETARMIMKEYGGKFPGSYNELIKLKGIGPYTAAAISSIAFKEPKAVVDGNVYRVLSRVYGITEPVNSTKGKLLFQELADELLDHKNPGDHNQALMEFGALLCKPKNPECTSCIFKEYCVAYRTDKISKLPVKSGRIKIKKRYLHYFLIVDPKNNFIIQKRSGNDIWKGLYELPLIETKDQEDILPSIDHYIRRIGVNGEFTLMGHKSFKHILSHRELIANFYTIKVKNLKVKPGQIMVDGSEIDSYALPRLIEKFLGTCNL